MSCTTSVGRLAVLRRKDTSTSPTVGIACSSSQPHSCSFFSSNEGVPSVVLSGPLHLSGSATQQRKSAINEASGFLDDGEKCRCLRREDACLSGEFWGVFHAADTRTPIKDEGALVVQSSPTLVSGYLRSPSVAGGRREEATEAQAGPGRFSPTACSKNDITNHTAPNLGFIDVGVTAPATVLKGTAGTPELAIGDKDRFFKGVSEKKTASAAPGSLLDYPTLHDGRLFMNCTNKNHMRSGKRKATPAPVGINTSYRSQQQGAKCICSKEKAILHHGAKKEQQQPIPFSSSLIFGSGDETKDRILQRSECLGKKKSVVAGSSWSLADKSQFFDEAVEEPVFLGTILEQGRGAMCEKEAVRWKRYCVLMQQQQQQQKQTVAASRETVCLGSGLQPIAATRTNSDDAAETFLPRRALSVPAPRDSSVSVAVTKTSRVVSGCIQRRPAFGETRAFGQHRMVEKIDEKGFADTTETLSATDFVEKKDLSVGTASRTEEKEEKYRALEKECEQLAKTVASLRSERDTLQEELAVQTIRNESLETSLIANEERYVCRQGEWLAREKELKKKQGQLALALRQIYRYVSSTADHVERNEKELKDAEARCRALDAELTATKTELQRMKEACTGRPEDGGLRGEQSGNFVEADMLLCCGDMNVDGDDSGEKEDEENEEEARKSCHGGLMVVDAALCEVLVRRLGRLLLALRRGESRRWWIVSRLIWVFRCLGARLFCKEKLRSVAKSLKQLVWSFERVLETNLGGTRPSLEAFGFEEDGNCELVVTNTHDDDDDDDDDDDAGNSIATLLNSARECVSRFVAWADALQRRHLEVVEELEVVRADRNELVGTQSEQVRLLQQELVAVGEERTRLLSLFDERAKGFVSVDEGFSRSLDFARAPASDAVHAPCEKVVAPRDGTVVLPATQCGDLERLAEHMMQQVELFGNSLHALFVETMRTVSQAVKRCAVSNEQLLVINKECEATQRVRDESPDALRTQLAHLQSELADRSAALRIVLQAQLRKDEVSDRGWSVKQSVSASASSAKALLTPCPSFPDSHFSRTGDDKYNVFSVNHTAGMLDDSSQKHLACGGCHDAAPSCLSGKNLGTRRMWSLNTLSTVLLGEYEQKSKGHSLCRDTSLRYPTALMPGVVSHSCSSGSPSKSAGDDRHSDCGFIHQRGIMRRHQEVWTKQAELMGLVTDEKAHIV